MVKEEEKIQYQDKWLILLGVPLINILNYYLTYPDIRFDTNFFLSYSIDTLHGYAGWYACRAVIFLLDRYYSWEKSIVKRMILQVPMVCIILLLTIVALEAIVNYLTKDTPVPGVFSTFNLHIFLIWGFFLNVLYLSLYLYNKLNSPLEAFPFGNKIWVKIGNQRHPIDLDKSICFYVEYESLFVLSPGGKQLMPGYTLDKVEKLADASKFFRANRQFLIGRDLIKSIRREENGKLSVILLPHADLPESIIVSRLRAPALEQWINT
jgi:DNA-binding LytR/AlgR family response regulator